MTGVSGVVSSQNSLVGSTQSEALGRRISSGGLRVVPLPNGDYVVIDDTTSTTSVVQAGSVTHGDGLIGTTGVITSANSLLGTTTEDFVGQGGITILANGNYVVLSPDWDNQSVIDAGALTLVDGDTGLTGTVNETNS